MCFLYILYSKKLNKFYIGSSTKHPSIRLQKHLTNHDGFTAKTKDWIIVHTETFPTITEARKREVQIKKWKSHIRIQQLINRSSTE
jgi:GIY-YIG catalytic domain.